ncbi:hypothetical protein [Actinomadura algeriensis]|uniref:Uncharacterized protein n=1 Tax=Actinomadura algeriensis TaxID=1679523 RepID=A0ABR9JQ84_9ACTN|nr:hypothetical protein [Actinomadura algeriensis]MBE1532546.1 hypothetical protein [Actinomadura algeriensis]
MPGVTVPGITGSRAPVPNAAVPGAPVPDPPVPGAAASRVPGAGVPDGPYSSFDGPVRRVAPVEVPADAQDGTDARTCGVRAGTIVDATARALVLDIAGTSVRIGVDEDVRVWHGERRGLAALRPGRRAIVRVGGGRDTGAVRADRIWVDIERVAGTITACGRDTVEVDMGPHRGRARVVIPPHAFGAVQVRHPRMQPGYLFDVICVGSPDGPLAVRPGTSQPGYRVADLAAPEPAAPVPGTLHGTVTWFGGLAATVGAAYPAVDPEGRAGGCADAPAPCVAMPYLSLGSAIVVRNECAGRERSVPVVECGCVAARFCDRCTECGASPRGRVAELTPAAFVALGGELDAGCFNATVRPVLGGRAARW